jgi:hypothetical protein
MQKTLTLWLAANTRVGVLLLTRATSDLLLCRFPGAGLAKGRTAVVWRRSRCAKPQKRRSTERGPTRAGVRPDSAGEPFQDCGRQIVRQNAKYGERLVTGIAYVI